MKRFIMTAITAAMMLTVPAIAAEGDSVTVYSNGNLVADKGIIVEGRTLVPVRGVFEYMGYEVEWDNDTKTATLTSSDNETVITLTNGESTFTVNDTAITPDVPQQIIDSRFMLPLRAVGEAVNAEVDWDAESKTAYIGENSAAGSTAEASTETATEETTESTTENTEVTTKTETIGNTTITSEITVPFVTIEGISPDEVPDGTVEIEVE